MKLEQLLATLPDGVLRYELENTQHELCITEATPHMAVFKYRSKHGGVLWNVAAWAEPRHIDALLSTYEAVTVQPLRDRVEKLEAFIKKAFLWIESDEPSTIGDAYEIGHEAGRSDASRDFYAKVKEHFPELALSSLGDGEPVLGASLDSGMNAAQTVGGD